MDGESVPVVQQGIETAEESMKMFLYSWMISVNKMKHGSKANLVMCLVDNDMVIVVVINQIFSGVFLFLSCSYQNWTWMPIILLCFAQKKPGKVLIWLHVLFGVTVVRSRNLYIYEGKMLYSLLLC